MAAKPLKKGAVLYNYILKALNEYNSSLPPKQQLTLSQRRKLVSSVIYPQFQDSRLLRKYEVTDRTVKEGKKLVRAVNKQRRAKAGNKTKLPVRPNKKGAALYQFIYSQTVAYNSSLPPKEQLSSKRLYNIASKLVYPLFKDRPKSKIFSDDIISEIKRAFRQELDDTRCHPLFGMTPEQYKEPVEYYLLDNKIKELPNCIFIKVTTYDYGQTEIFNTRDYTYGGSGVQDIINNISLSESVNFASGLAVFSGYLKIIDPKKQNYPIEKLKGKDFYIDFILTIKGEDKDQGDTNGYVIPKSGLLKIEKARKAVGKKLLTKNAKRLKETQKFNYVKRKHIADLSKLKKLVEKINRSSKKEVIKDLKKSVKVIKAKMKDRIEDANDRNLFLSLKTYKFYLAQVDKLKPKK